MSSQHVIDCANVRDCVQVLQHADVAFFFGMIDKQQRIDAMTMQLLISQLIADGTCYKSTPT